MPSLKPKGDFILKRNALIEYYFHTDPDQLNDIEWAIKWEQLKWILKSIGRLKDE